MQYYEDEHYRVSFYEGKSRDCILAFGGVGHALNGIQIEEFRNSIDGALNAFFFIDKERSWWNNGDILAVFREVAASIEERGFPRVSAIGNSMGGSGALLAARFMDRVTRCVSVVPQAVVSDFEAERRWLSYREKIETFEFPSYAVMRPGCAYRIVFGADDEPYQPARFREKGFDVELVPGCDHNVIRFVKGTPFYDGLIRFATFDDA